MTTEKPMGALEATAECIRLREAILRAGRLLIHAGVGLEHLRIEGAAPEVTVLFPAGFQAAGTVHGYAAKGVDERRALAALLSNMVQSMCNEAAKHLQAAIEAQVRTGRRTVRSATTTKLARLIDKL